MTHKGNKYLTVKEAMVKLEISIATLYRIISEGAFCAPGETFMLRGRRMFSEKAIEKYIDSQINCS